MKKWSKSLIFVGKLTFVYLFLVMGCSALKLNLAYRNMFMHISKSLYSDYGVNGRVGFEKLNAKHFTQNDLNLILVDKTDLAVAKTESDKTGRDALKMRTSLVGINTWQFALLPYIFLMALVLVSPVSLKQKLWPIVLSFIIFNAFVILIKLNINLLNQFQKVEWLMNKDYSEMKNTWIANIADKILNFGTGIIIAIFVWIPVTFSLVDLDKIKSKFYTFVNKQ